MELDLKQIEALMVLMEKHVVDTVQIGEIKIEKKIHLPKAKKDVKKADKPVNLSNEDLLFYSSKAPPIQAKRLSKFLPKDLQVKE